MRMHDLLPKTVYLLFPCLLLLAACGTSTSTSAGASATATACAQATRRPASASSFKTATGTLNKINGQTLTLTNQRSQTVTVTYTSSTTVTQESTIPATSLKEGSNVRVTVTSNNGSYSAVSITALSGSNSGSPFGTGTRNFGRGTGSTNPCASAARRRFGQGTSGNTGNSGNSTNNFRGLVGTVGQLNGTSLTITDTSGAAYTVAITPQTRIVQTASVTAAVLKVGQPLTIVGKAGSQGTIAASSIAILLSLPTPRSTPTPAQ